MFGAYKSPACSRRKQPTPKFPQPLPVSPSDHFLFSNMSSLGLPAGAHHDTMKTDAAAVENIARQAGKLAMSHFQSFADLPVEQKGQLDLVTAADQDVEVFLIKSLLELFPDDAIVGEETGQSKGISGRTWVIDPIDGTFNFVRGSRDWAISIGLFENRRPTFGVVFAPARDLMFVGGTSVETRLNGKPMQALPAFDLSRACLGIGIHPTIPADDRVKVIYFTSVELPVSLRCCGSATLSFIAVALGETDGYLSLGDASWDVTAALPILANLGISHTINWDNTDLRRKLRYACGKQAFLEKLRPLLKDLGANGVEDS